MSVVSRTLKKFDHFRGYIIRIAFFFRKSFVEKNIGSGIWNYLLASELCGYIFISIVENPLVSLITFHWVVSVLDFVNNEFLISSLYFAKIREMNGYLFFRRELFSMI